MANSASITIPVETVAKELDLTIIERGSGRVTFTTAEIGRPGLPFAGYYNHFLGTRVQLIGNSEMHYLYSLSSAEISDRMAVFMSYNLPCIVCARGNMPPEELVKSAKEHQLAVFLSALKTDEIGHKVTNYLSRKLAPSMLTHGVLVDVFGIGILLKGESGIGKSETALEMIKQGHRLVADDAVRITRVAPNRLVGSAPEATRYLIEVRGIGVVDVRYLFGAGSAVSEKSIDMVMNLEIYDPTAEYDRLGTNENTVEFFGVDVPETRVPISPGRNIAVVVEIAARNMLMKKLGYDTSGNAAKRIEKVFGGV